MRARARMDSCALVVLMFLRASAAQSHVHMKPHEATRSGKGPHVRQRRARPPCSKCIVLQCERHVHLGRRSVINMHLLCSCCGVHVSPCHVAATHVVVAGTLAHN